MHENTVKKQYGDTLRFICLYKQNTDSYQNALCAQSQRGKCVNEML